MALELTSTPLNQSWQNTKTTVHLTALMFPTVEPPPVEVDQNYSKATRFPGRRNLSTQR